MKNKLEFMRELEFLLQDVAEDEKREAIEYYYDYFEDAGEHNEYQVVTELGSPERIAAIIRADLNASLGDGGEFTENGYEDSRFKIPNRVPAEYTEIVVKEQPIDEPDRDEGAVKRQFHKPITILLLIVIGLAILPVVFGAVGSVFGVLLGLAACALGILLIPGVATFGCFIGGLCGLFISLTFFIRDTAAAVAGGGACLALLGFSLCLFVFSKWFYTRLVPMLFRIVTGVIGALLKNNRRRRQSE